MNQIPASLLRRFAFFIVFLLALSVWSLRTPHAHAQNALPVPTPTPISQTPPQATPTPTALPSSTPGAVSTPSPGSLPSYIPQAPTQVIPNPLAIVPGFSDPSILPQPPPLILPTATPLPAPTEVPVPTALPLPLGDGDVRGEEPPSDRFYLDAPGAVYDQESKIGRAEGDVTFGYGEYFRAQGQRGELNLNEGVNTATLSGDLTITARAGGRTQVFTGQSLVFNVQTGRWILSQVRATFPPQLFPPGTVLAPLYQTNGTLRGQNNDVLGENFRFTSCDREHYYIRSNRIDIYRNPQGIPARITLRKNAIFLLGHEILPLPVYTISLLGQRSRTQPLQTSFGQNDVDGFFAKTIYDIRASSKFTDSLLVDALSKRGLGLGIQRELIGGGLVYLYAVSGKTGGREVNSRINKTYQISKLVGSNISFQSTQNNSVAGSGLASSSGNFSLYRNGARAQTNVLYNFSSSRSSISDGSALSEFNTRNDILSVQHLQTFGAGLALQVNGTLNQSDFSGTGSPNSLNQKGDLVAALTRTSDLFTARLLTELHNDFRQGNAAYQVEKLPELTLESSIQQLKLGDGFNKIIPGRLSFSTGIYNEPITTTNVTGVALGGQKSRTDFTYSSNTRRIRLFGKEPDKQSSNSPAVPDNPTAIRRPSGSVLDVSGQFEQTFYSDNTAQYNYSYNVTNTNTLGPLQVLINYAKQRNAGFTPFQFDYRYPGEYLDYVASIGRTTNFNFSLSGGRDIQFGVNRDLVANAQWIPARGTYLSLATSYGLDDERRGLFGDIYGNVKFTRPSANALGTQFSLGFRYSPSGITSAQGLTRVNASVATNITRKVRFQAFVGYDGVNNRFDFQQYRATIDLHCFNLFTTYDSSTKQLRFDIALKAFPFTDSRLGRNNFSEGFDPSVGTVQ